MVDTKEKLNLAEQFVEKVSPLILSFDLNALVTGKTRRSRRSAAGGTTAHFEERRCRR